MTSVLWFQGGACSGNTMSFINAAEPSVVDLIVDYGLEIVYHPTLSMEIGKTAQDLFWSYAKGEKEIDIFVYEGSVIEGPNGSGRFDMFAGRPMKDWVDDIAPKAGIVVAIGDCATWGGLPAVPPNPSRLAAACSSTAAASAAATSARTSSASSACRSSTSPAARRTRTGSARSSSRWPPAASATSRSTSCSGPTTFFTSFTQTGCTRVQFYTYKQDPPQLRPGHAHRLPVLRVRLPRPDDALAVQPHPVEPAVVEDPRRPSLHRLHRAGLPARRPREGHRVQDPEGRRRHPQGRAGRHGRRVVHGAGGPVPRGRAASGPRKTCSSSDGPAHADELQETTHMTTMDLHVSPLGQVEGDLDVKVTITDGVVTDAWTEAAMFRGFEIILRGKDPQAGLIMTPRICGICGGSHLYKACYAVDTAWGTYVPPNATRVRNLGQITETLQCDPALLLRDHGPGPHGRAVRRMPARTRRRPAASPRTSARATRPA